VCSKATVVQYLFARIATCLLLRLCSNIQRPCTDRQRSHYVSILMIFSDLFTKYNRGRIETSSAPSSRFSSCLSRCDKFGSRIHRITCVIVSISAFSITNITVGLQCHTQATAMLTSVYNVKYTCQDDVSIGLQKCQTTSSIYHVMHEIFDELDIHCVWKKRANFDKP